MSQNGQLRSALRQVHDWGLGSVTRILRQPLMVGTLLVAASSPAAAVDGNALHRMCNGGDNHGRSICMGYVAGVNDAWQGLASANGDRLNFCLPRNVQLGQMTDVVSQHLARNPATRDMPGFLLVGTAFVEAWPCASRR